MCLDRSDRSYWLVYRLVYKLSMTRRTFQTRLQMRH